MATVSTIEKGHRVGSACPPLRRFVPFHDSSNSVVKGLVRFRARVQAAYGITEVAITIGHTFSISTRLRRRFRRARASADSTASILPSRGDDPACWSVPSYGSAAMPTEHCTNTRHNRRSPITSGGLRPATEVNQSPMCRYALFGDEGVLVRELVIGVGDRSPSVSLV